MQVIDTKITEKIVNYALVKNHSFLMLICRKLKSILY